MKRARGAIRAIAQRRWRRALGEKQKLFGQAIRFTNKALALERAIAMPSRFRVEAMVEMGAVPGGEDSGQAPEALPE